MALWLDPIPPECRRAAVAALEARDVTGFLIRAGNHDSLALVSWNLAPLRARGLYEAALLDAFTSNARNNSGWPADHLRWLFKIADRERLRACGDPLPGPGPFTVYRGVAGRGAARRIRGLSWTGDPERARWFANRWGLYDPAVFEMAIPASKVLAYVNDRQEQEFVVLVPASARVVRAATGLDLDAAAR
jgi:hypothetical protein